MPLNPAKPLQLYDLPPDTFQRFCRELFQELPEVKESLLYGANGQRQDGIDILVSLKTGSKWAGQCKACEPKTERKHLKNAAEDFREYLSRWRSEGVTKLIVLLGCGFEDRHANDDKLLYERELSKEGIELEVWDSYRIEKVLRPMRPLVQRYFGTQTPEERICGPIPQTASPVDLSIPPEFLSALRDSKNVEIEQIRNLIQEGKETEAESKLLAMRASSGWNILPPDIRARVLRVLAGFELSRRGNLAKVQELVEEAKRAHPEGRFAVIDATIKLHAEGAEPALKGMPEPANIDEWNMRAALQVNAGMIDEALRNLESPAFSLNTETLRLKAITLLIHREPAKALVVAQEAIEQAPTWVLVQEVLALAHFFCAVSPAFDGWGVWTQTLPIPWEFVKADPASKKHLEAAAEQFLKLAKAADNGSPAWASAKTGQLASLSCIHGNQAVAESVLGDIFTGYPGYPAAVHWALIRGYSIDLEATQLILEKACAPDSKNIEPVLALFHVFSYQEKFEEAGRILDTYRSVFERMNGLGAWQLMRGQVWMALGKKDEADKILAEISESKLKTLANTETLRISGEKDEWTPELLARIEHEAVTSKSPALLYKACVAHYSAGKFAWIADRAEELICRMSTETALRLALDSAARSERFRFCLELMERHGTQFWGNNPPTEADRLRAQCEIALGNFPKAEQDLARLVDREGATADRFALFETQLRSGKRAEAIVTAQRLVGDPDVNQTGLLRIADATVNIDRNVAVNAFNRALSRPLPKELILPVIDMGFRLDLEHKVSAFIRKLPQLAAEAELPVRSMTLDEIIELRKEQNEEARRLESEYRRGAIPIHGYAKALNTPIAAMFAVPLAGQAGPLYQRWSARIRYGARTIPTELVYPDNVQKMALFLDITSLLLAGELGIVELLTTEFAPVYISSSTVEALQQQIDVLSHPQPSRISAMRQVVQLVEQKSISIWGADYKDIPTDCVDPTLQQEFGVEWLVKAAFCRDRKGRLIDFFPVLSSKRQPLAIPSALAPFVCGPETALAALVQAGKLSTEQQNRARESIKIPCTPNPSSPTFPEFTYLLLDSGLAEHLANAGLLGPLATYGRVSVTQDELNQIQLELKSQEGREALKDSLVRLVDKIRGYLEAGVFQMQTSEAKDAVLCEPKDGPLWRCLRDLVDVNRAADIVTCCDDRFFSRYTKVGNSPVCGTFDLLWHLRRNGKLDTSGLFVALYRMRAANMRYLPLSADEIIHHVQPAEVKDGMLVETPELEVLRQSAAAGLLDWEVFQNLPPGHPLSAEYSEIVLVIRLQHIVAEAILQIWRTESWPQEKRIAACDWILFSLWTSFAGVLTFRNPSAPRRAPRYLTGITSFLIESVNISLDGKGRKQRRYFYEWLFSRICKREDLLRFLGPEIHEMLLSLLDRSETQQEQAASRYMAFEIYTALPRSVRAAIHFTKQQMSDLGLRDYYPVQFGDHIFAENEFWEAAEKAMMGGRATLVTQSQKPKNFSVCAEATKSALTFTSADKSIRFRITDPMFEVLSGDFKSRVAALRTFRTKMDLSSQEDESAMRKFAKVKSAQTRIRIIRNRLRESVSYQLSASRGSLEGNGSFQIESVRPISRQALLRHLRLPENIEQDGLPAFLEKSAKALLEDEGFVEAFARVASLPVTLPSVIRVAYRKLSSDNQLQVQRHFAHHHAPPLLRLQWAKLMADCGDERVNCAVDVLEELTSPAAENIWQLFETLLVWTWGWLGGDREGGTPESLSLLVASWLHASRIHELLSGGGEEERTVQFFIQDMSPMLGFGSHPAVGFDVASPRGTKRIPTIVWGAAEVLDGTALSEHLVGRLRESVGKIAFPQTSAPHPDLELLEQDNGLENVLNSFLNRNTANTLTKFLPEEQVEQLSSKHMQDLTDAYLVRVKSNPSDADLWLGLAIVLRLNPPLPSQRASLQDLLASFSFTKLQNPRIGALSWIAGCLFGQAAYFADAFDFGFWNRQMLDLSDVLAKPEGNFTGEESSQLLSYSVLILANALPENCLVSRLSLLSSSIVTRHPRFGSKLLSDTIRIVIREAPDQAAEAWKSITELRFFASH